MRCRTITYPGTFEPVEKTCRARLSNGKLCSRMDRFKVCYLVYVYVRNSALCCVTVYSTTQLLLYQTGIYTTIIRRYWCVLRCFLNTQCPFHGTIIPRDEQGDPVSKSQPQSIVPLDPELQEAIRDAQGTELLQGRKEKKKGGKSQEYVRSTQLSTIVH